MVAEPLCSLFSPSRSAWRKHGLGHLLHLGDHSQVVWLDSLLGTATCKSITTHTAKHDLREWMHWWINEWDTSFLSYLHVISRERKRKSDLSPNHVSEKHCFHRLLPNHIWSPELLSAPSFLTMWSLKLLLSPLQHTTLIASFPQSCVHSWLDSSPLPCSSNHDIHIPLSIYCLNYIRLPKPSNTHWPWRRLQCLLKHWKTFNVWHGSSPKAKIRF